VPYSAVDVGDTVLILEALNSTLDISNVFRDPVTGAPLNDGAVFSPTANVTWQINYLGDQVYLHALAVIPEPATATLLGLSLLALARRRKRGK